MHTYFWALYPHVLPYCLQAPSPHAYACIRVPICLGHRLRLICNWAAHVCFFQDMAKACESVWHSRMLYKLHEKGGARQNVACPKRAHTTNKDHFP